MHDWDIYSVRCTMIRSGESLVVMLFESRQVVMRA